jgi:hypothetical protein
LYRYSVVRHEGQLRQAAAVCCTCAAAGGEMLESAQFGAVLLDEASQQVELASLVALARGARAVVGLYTLALSLKRACLQPLHL